MVKTHGLQKILAWLRHPGDTLSRQVLHGGVWVLASRIANRGFALFRIVFLARLLAPGDFGLFGIAMLALSSLESFSKTGFDQALIRNRGDCRPYLDSAWTVQVIRGAFLALILVIGAPLVGSFFSEPRVIPIVRVLGLVEFIRGLKNIGLIYFRKDLEFHKQFLYDCGATLVDLVVTLPLAVVFRSVWVLVLGSFARSVVEVILSYILHGFRPSIDFDKSRLVELVSFGQWVFGLSIVVFLATQGDDILVGRVLGAVELGLYQLAFRLSNVPATEITHVVSQVTLPAYSKLQDSESLLSEAFLRTLYVTILVALPITLMILILSPNFVRVLLDEQWVSMIPSLRVLAISGLLRSIVISSAPLFKAVGRPSFDFYMNLIKLVLISATIYPLTVNFGIVGSSASVLIGTIAAIPYWWRKSSSIVSIRMCKTSRLFLPLLAGNFLVGGVLSVLTIALPFGRFSFALQMLTSIGMYAAIFLIVWKFCKSSPVRTMLTPQSH